MWTNIFVSEKVKIEIDTGKKNTKQHTTEAKETKTDRYVWPSSRFFLLKCLTFLYSQHPQFPVSHQHCFQEGWQALGLR